VEALVQAPVMVMTPSFVWGSTFVWESVTVDVYVAWYCVVPSVGPGTIVVPAVNDPPLGGGLALLVNVHCVAPAGGVHVTCVLPLLGSPPVTVVGFKLTVTNGKITIT